MRWQRPLTDLLALLRPVEHTPTGLWPLGAPRNLVRAIRGYAGGFLADPPAGGPDDLAVLAEAHALGGLLAAGVAAGVEAREVAPRDRAALPALMTGLLALSSTAAGVLRRALIRDPRPERIVRECVAVAARIARCYGPPDVWTSEEPSWAIPATQESLRLGSVSELDARRTALAEALASAGVPATAGPGVAGAILLLLAEARESDTLRSATMAYPAGLRRGGSAGVVAEVLALARRTSGDGGALVVLSGSPAAVAVDEAWRAVGAGARHAGVEVGDAPGPAGRVCPVRGADLVLADTALPFIGVSATELDGTSFGLAAAIAVATALDGRPSTRRVAATGGVRRDGKVTRVDAAWLGPKHDAVTDLAALAGGSAWQLLVPDESLAGAEEASARARRLANERRARGEPLPPWPFVVAVASLAEAVPLAGLDRQRLLRGARRRLERERPAGPPIPRPARSLTETERVLTLGELLAQGFVPNPLHRVMARGPGRVYADLREVLLSEAGPVLLSGGSGAGKSLALDRTLADVVAGTLPWLPVRVCVYDLLGPDEGWWAATVQRHIDPPVESLGPILGMPLLVLVDGLEHLDSETFLRRCRDLRVVADGGARLVLALPDWFLLRAPAALNALFTLWQGAADDPRWVTVRPSGLDPDQASAALASMLGTTGDAARLRESVPPALLRHPLVYGVALSLGAGALTAGPALTPGAALERLAASLRSWGDPAGALLSEELVDELALECVAAGGTLAAHVIERAASRHVGRENAPAARTALERSILRPLGAGRFGFLHDGLLPPLAARALASRLRDDLGELGPIEDRPMARETLSAVAARGSPADHARLARLAARATPERAYLVASALCEGSGGRLDEWLAGSHDASALRELRARVEAAVLQAGEAAARILREKSPWPSDRTGAFGDLVAGNPVNDVLRFVGSPVRAALGSAGPGKTAVVVVRVEESLERTAGEDAHVWLVHELLLSEGLDLHHLGACGLREGRSWRCVLVLAETIELKVASIATEVDSEVDLPLAAHIQAALDRRTWHLYRSDVEALRADLTTLVARFSLTTAPPIPSARLQALEDHLQERSLPVLDALHLVATDVAGEGPLAWIATLADIHSERATRLAWLYVSASAMWSEERPAYALYSDVLLSALVRCVDDTGALRPEALRDYLGALASRVERLRTGLMARVAERCLAPGRPEVGWTVPGESLLRRTADPGTARTLWRRLFEMQDDPERDADVSSFLEAVAPLIAGALLDEDGGRRRSVERLAALGVVATPDPEALRAFLGAPESIDAALGPPPSPPLVRDDPRVRLRDACDREDPAGGLAALASIDRPGAPPPPEALWLGRWLVARDHPDALSVAQRAAGRRDERSLHLLATALLRAGRPVDALSVARDARREHPANVALQAVEALSGSMAVQALPPGPERDEAAPRWRDALDAAIQALRSRPHRARAEDLCWAFPGASRGFRLVLDDEAYLVANATLADLALHREALEALCDTGRAAAAVGRILANYRELPLGLSALSTVLEVCRPDERVRLAQESWGLHAAAADSVAARGLDAGPLEREALLRAAREEERLAPSHGGARFAAADRLDRVGLHDAAAARFESAAAAFPLGSPEQLEALRRRGRSLLQAAGRGREARSIYTDLVTRWLRGDRVTSQIALDGAGLMLDGSIPRIAWRQLSEAMRSIATSPVPGLPPADRALALRYSARALLGAADEGEPVLEQCLADAVGGDFWMCIVRGSAMRRLGRFGQARAAFEAAEGSVASLEEAVRLRLEQSELAHAEGRDGRAVSALAWACALTRLGRLDPRQGVQLMFVGETLLRLGHPAAAAEVLARWLALPDQDAEARAAFDGLRRTSLALAGSADEPTDPGVLPHDPWSRIADAVRAAGAGASVGLLLAGAPRELCIAAIRVLSAYEGSEPVGIVLRRLREIAPPANPA